MKFDSFRKAWVGLLILAFGAGLGSLRTCAETAPSADEIIAKAVARAKKVEAGAGQAGVTYSKITVVETLDKEGNVKDRTERVYHVVFKEGTTYLKLEQVNGHTPGSAEIKQHAENESNFRLLSRQSGKGKGDRRESLLSAELAARFSYSLVRQAPIAGRPAYEVAFSPRNPLPPMHHIADHFLSRLSGSIWIDAEEFEVARIEVGLSKEVELLGGAVGTLKKLAYTLNRTRLPDGLWINESSTGNMEGRKLIEPVRLRTQSRSQDFQPIREPS